MQKILEIQNKELENISEFIWIKNENILLDAKINIFDLLLMKMMQRLLIIKLQKRILKICIFKYYSIRLF